MKMDGPLKSVRAGVNCNRHSIENQRNLTVYLVWLDQLGCYVIKSGNWGLDEIDCHRSHKRQCTSKKYFSSY